MPSRLVRIAALGALLAALGVSGCGRKGGLDPPPAGATTAQEQTGAGAGQEGVVADGRPPVPEEPSRRTVIDWLLD